MLTGMKRGQIQCVWLLGVLLTGAVPASVRADVKDNPFQTIIERNPFGLKPAPVTPPITTEPATPPPPAVAVKVTGVTDILGKKMALVELTEQGPGKTAKKMIMQEAQVEGLVEVLHIDVAKAFVKIKNGELITNMTFEVIKSAPALPAATAAYNPGTNAMSTAVIIGGNDHGGGGVSVAGGSNPAGLNSVVADNSGSRAGLPPRQLRVQENAAAQLDIQKQIAMMEVQRKLNENNPRSAPLPFTVVTPNQKASAANQPPGGRQN